MICAHSLLADNPLSARSIANRFTYLDPLNHLQGTLLERYRAGDTDPLLQYTPHMPSMEISSTNNSSSSLMSSSANWSANSRATGAAVAIGLMGTST